MSNDQTPQWGPPNNEQPQQGQAPYGQNPYAQQGQNPYAQQPYAQPYPQYAQPIPVGPDGTPPLWAPWYGIGFLDAFTRFFKKYARFDGRASRSEYWFWVLGNAIVTIVLLGGYLVSLFSWLGANTTTDAYGNTQTTTTGAPVLALVFIGLLGLWWLATLVPNIALGWRRVHDANLAGPFWIIALFVGIAAVVFGCLGPNPAGAQYDRPDLG